ncbi:MAG: type II toxin-antitoxin system VapC family toxin [Terracidiphilus sp.]
MSLILDSSATLARVFPDERTGAIIDAFEFVANFGAIVPDLWRIEVANALNMGIRRGRIGKSMRDSVLADLGSLPIQIDRETQLHTWGRTLELADLHRLTVYDATYLELALRLSLPLATLDDELRQAAQQEGVPLAGK